MAVVTLGWRVYRVVPKTTKRGSVRWEEKAISDMFTVEDSAKQFAALAEKQFFGDKIVVKPVPGIDQVTK